MRHLLIVALIIILSNAAYTEGQNQPLVVFIFDNDWLTASSDDPGADGISRMAEIFQELGARTETLSLAEPLPVEADVVVLARPLRAIPADALAHLWAHIEKGNNFLLTIDPIGYPEERTESANGGLGKLLTSDYGVSFRDTFLAEPWFTNDTVANIEGSIVQTYADNLEPHPVIEPLARFDVPIYVRGARTVRTEPFGISSFAYPLLLTNSAYGETTREVFTADVPARLELNIGLDEMGTLVLAGLGENMETGSRIAVLGDTAVVQNGFGLEQIISSDSGEEVARFPGDRILVERLAAWLLDVPIEDWPALPPGFTWLGLDGDGSDWGEAQRAMLDDDDTQSVPPEYDIQQVRAFRNDDSLYILVETSAALPPSLSLQLRVEQSGGDEIAFSADADEVVVVEDDGETPVPDARLVAGQVVEVRIPLRVAGFDRELTIDEVCLGASAGEPADCMSEGFAVRHVLERDPASLRFLDGPLVSLNNPGNRGTNLRAGPGTDFAALTTLGNGALMVARGRNEAGDWVYVESARYGGWVSASLITSTGEISQLAVLEP